MAWWLYNLLVLASLAGVLGMLAINLAVFPSLPRMPRRASSGPRVSVLVPARNEAGRIGSCLESLTAQDYPDFEVLVLDDESTDGTSGVARRTGFAAEGRFRIISGTPLRQGWVGKCWACHQLAGHAAGDYLFFTDADTVHGPSAIRAAVEMAQAHRADLLSAWPRLVTLTWSERLVIPLIHLLAAAIYPHGLLAAIQARPALAKRLPERWLRLLGAANGQFLFFRREAYDAIGGHASVRDHLVEDVALGREVARRAGAGLRLVNCDASRVSACRMYESFEGVWEGFTKNLRAAFERSLGSFLCMGVLQFCCFLLPFALALMPVGAKGLILLQVALICSIRLILTIRFRTSWFGCVAHPLGMMLALAIALNSWRRLSGPGVTWKGRTYGGSR